MSLLTDEEIRKWWTSENGLEDCQLSKLDDFHKAIRAAEAAILAKLASAELPEPTGVVDRYLNVWQLENQKPLEDGEKVYTADQLHQAYAQGAASQLAEKPEAYGCRTADGVVRDCVGPDSVFANERQYTVPLYTRRQV